MTPQEYLDRFFITEEDLAVLRKYKPTILPIVGNVVTEALVYFEKYKEKGATRSRESLEKHWTDFWDGTFDETRIKERIQTGRGLSAMGMPIDMYQEIAATFLHLFSKHLRQIPITDPDIYIAFQKMLQLDITIVIQEHNAYTLETMRAQNEMLMEMSTPIAQLWDEILMLPLVGIMDSKRTKEVMTNMLTSISEKQAKAFILDISGVAVVDTAVANYFIRMSQAAQLMGCQCVISGISPAVAETMVALGIQLEQIRTTGSMKDALQIAFGLAKNNNVQHE